MASISNLSRSRERPSRIRRLTPMHVRLPVQSVDRRQHTASIMTAKRSVARSRKQDTRSPAGGDQRGRSRDVVCAAGIEVDLTNRLVRHHGRTIELTPRQFDLLACLIRHAGRTVSREEIAGEVWGDPTAVWTNVISVAVHEVRRKIETLGRPTIVCTVRGSGYRIGEVSDDDRAMPPADTNDPDAPAHPPCRPSPPSP